MRWRISAGCGMKPFADRGLEKWPTGNPKSQHFVRCATCGCVMCWQKIAPHPENRTGVNARNFEPEVLRTIRVVALDGASLF